MADTFVAERVTCMLEQMRTHPELKHVHSREDALYYLGSKFEVVFREKRGAGVGPAVVLLVLTQCSIRYRSMELHWKLMMPP